MDYEKTKRKFRKGKNDRHLRESDQNLLHKGSKKKLMEDSIKSNKASTMKR